MDPTTAADTLKIVLLGDEVSFDCAVESADVTEVSIWWQKDEANLTITNEEKYSLKVTKEKLLFSIFLFPNTVPNMTAYPIAKIHNVLYFYRTLFSTFQGQNRFLSFGRLLTHIFT